MPSVYALGDPRTNQIRYVGIAQDVYKRYAQHLNHPHQNDVKNVWMQEIKAAGVVPTLAILEADVDEAIIYEREKHWIQHYLTMGTPLTNIVHAQKHQKITMRDEKLSPDVAAYVQHIKGWETLIRDEVAIILEKLYKDEPLSRTELHMDVTPSEVAAIWSVKNKTDINPKYVREVKRKNRITPSEEWGTGPSYRCLYRVRDVLPIEVGHERGRPKRQAQKEPDREAA